MGFELTETNTWYNKETEMIVKLITPVGHSTEYILELEQGNTARLVTELDKIKKVLYMYGINCTVN